MTPLRIATDPDGVATFTIDRPEVLNALTVETYEALRDAFVAADTNKGVRAIVLTGAGGAFSSGGHVGETIGQLIESNKRSLLRFNQLTGSVVLAMRALTKPVVAAIDGVAAGGGAALALAADMRIASPGARLGFLFARVGLSAADMGVTWLLPRLVGLGRATELLLTGAMVGAPEALAMGLVNRVVHETSALGPATALARELAQGPVLAHAATKRMLEISARTELEPAMAAEAVTQTACMGTQDFREGYAAFLQKRPPRFRGT
jgi:enoyl-CoA hydratase/carnithine racemase